ncbi:polyprenyl synthetase family protein [Haliea sp. AH-315-K21]|uniref:Geranyl transferase n=1 Tax=SAR86 cluster bacterium TaxID=2030880 RepID=A0A2A5CD92_9GAMM|nr:polyprenyl synthetase family protein [Haliea sp. AH-315-K21]PCJ41837.1 MAG: geranyl transferase [SAR86 cluster bacterium]
MQIQQFLTARKSRVEKLLAELLSAQNSSSILQDAMTYAVMNGGKRLRPILAYASAQAVGVDEAHADIAACAVELIHTYSLIHDDLPAMDDDVLRRGVATCHIKFDEATAILAGDALHSYAFELLAASTQIKASNEIRLQMLVILAKAIGATGMVAGQSLDLQASSKNTNAESLATLHSLKTGALITASVQLGALSSGGIEQKQFERLSVYARAIGHAFQVQDDILDIESDTETLGKQQGKDKELGKVTYPVLLGLDGAKQKAQALYEEANAALEDFGQDAQALREIALYVVQRKH